MTLGTRAGMFALTRWEFAHSPAYRPKTYKTTKPITIR